ncbi:MAG: non-ribosomal peptide synthetase [Nocardioides sp.]|uniref:non-ribosomal peptide synthetase n=1 Tax=Nocardioides sp. TaxID=35761 RepID=UPI0023A28626|nr:non-ribosomal peptide synthetase [Nocardioides sp.]MDE0775690.1 non-ribosomal peptide synthetase [Nocardioides sp.]
MTKLLILDRIKDIAAREPHRPALRVRESTLNFGALTEAAAGLASLLREHGTGPEDVVASVLTRGGNPIIVMLAAWMSGAAYLPVDPKWPESRRSLVLNASATVVVVESADHDAHPGMPGEPGLAVRTLGQSGSPAHAGDASGLNLAYVICTSGSTGSPLAVGVEFSAMDNYAAYVVALGEQPEIRQVDNPRVLLSADLAFDASLRPVFLLAAGIELVVAPDLTEGSWQEHIDYITTHNVTILSGVPSWYAGLLGAGFAPESSAVRLAFIGGEAVPNGIVRQLVSDRCAVVVQYGPTETAVAATGGRLLSDEFLQPPIGDAVPGVRVHLYDGVALGAARAGKPAFLYVGGAGVARGYLHDPRLTAERFVPDPSGPPGSRMFHTGDLAKLLPRGGYAFLGRTDDQVKISGRRIELGEISSVVNRHPDVAQSVAFVHRDSAHPLLVAAYVGTAGVDAVTLEASVQDYLACELPSYEVPHLIRCEDSLPMTERGKVDVTALARLVKPVEVNVPADETEMTDVERSVIAIVRKTLDAPCSLDDEFFGLGLTSLDSLNILAQIREELGVRVRLRDFFQAGTTRNLCELIELAS